jgi:hypothetical protein
LPALANVPNGFQKACAKGKWHATTVNIAKPRARPLESSSS